MCLWRLASCPILKHLDLPLLPRTSSYIINSQESLKMDLMNHGLNSPQQSSPTSPQQFSLNSPQQSSPNPNHPQQSIERRTVRQRQSSTSSSGSADSPHTRPCKAIRSSRRQTSPSGFQGAEDEQSSSRRGSMSTMRTSSTPLECPVTYTPTTHRISKAKKGKRVHACEFVRCNKVCSLVHPGIFSADHGRYSPGQSIEGDMS